MPSSVDSSHTTVILGENDSVNQVADFDQKSDPYLVCFDEGDPAYPKNWSSLRRWYLTLPGGLLVLNATFASSAPAGIVPQLLVVGIPIWLRVSTKYRINTCISISRWPVRSRTAYKFWRPDFRPMGPRYSRQSSRDLYPGTVCRASTRSNGRWIHRCFGTVLALDFLGHDHLRWSLFVADCVHDARDLCTNYFG